MEDLNDLIFDPNIVDTMSFEEMENLILDDNDDES